MTILFQPYSKKLRNMETKDKIFVENLSDKRRCGIYCIKNVITGKVYIGGAYNMYDRRRHHLSDLRNGRHENKRLQLSFLEENKTESVFLFGVIEYVERCDLRIKEQYWIDYFNSYNPDKGYNISPFSDRPSAWYEKKHHTEESKRKISESNRGTVFSAERRKNQSLAQLNLYKNGYIHPSKGKKGKSGKDSGSWKGGKPKCPICGVQLTSYTVSACIKHVKANKIRLKYENIDLSVF